MNHKEITCLKCGRVAFEATPEYIKNESGNIDSYKHCLCGNSYKNFRDAKEGDCPDGVTINAVLTREFD